MPASVGDIFPSIRPLWALENRLLYHMGTGKRLDGLQYDPGGKVEVKGKADMPLLQPFELSETEDSSIGGGSNPLPVGNGPKVDVHVISYRLSVDIANGPFRSDPLPSFNAKRAGLCEWTALVRDALERTTDGEDRVDSKLDGLLVRPMQFVVEDAGMTGIAWEAIVRVTLNTQLYFPGSRACITTGALAD